MALRKVKGTLERVLDKNLQDLVRGIRNHKENESKYIAECIDEIKQELKQENLAIKANAVNKLTYLQMLGYDISWAAFNIIEVMSSTKFTFKRIGYLAASQSFHEETDVLMLTTNMIRKDMSSQNMYDSGVALNGLSCFITPDLARDLANDIMTLMTSSRPYLRKKAVLIMYKVFLQFPEALRPAFPRLKEKLEDPDPGVQSAAVNVICELARKNPKNYLSLAPLFFKLMTTSTNNWVLIKIIKLFSALTPLEPRLGKKLIEPLTNLIHSTSAMSLLYECINTVTAVLVSISSGIPNHSASIQLCVQKLRILIEDSDQNLKYLGLLAMSRILASHPKSVQGHKDLILQCLDDRDESIRLRALDLLYGMVSKKNLMEIVKKLMVHMDKAEGSHYRDELLSKTVEICSQSNYQYVTNFEWYVSILVELTRMEGTKHGKLIANQMLDVAIRVQAIRHFAVSQMAILLENSHILANNSQRNGICEVLYAAAWICGEFSEHLNDPKATLEAMLRPKITSLPGHIQSVFVQNILKLYGKILKAAEAKEEDGVKAEVHALLQEKLPVFVQSGDLEVQERACSILQIVKYIVKLEEKGAAVADEVEGLYAGELNPVASKAQKKVPVPEGLDLDKWINEPLEDSSDEEVNVSSFFVAADDQHRSSYQYEESKTYQQPTEEELEKRREARKTEVEHNPHYLKDDGRGRRKRDAAPDTSNIPVAEIDLSIPLHVPVGGDFPAGISSSDKYMMLQQQAERSKREKREKGGKKKKKKGKSSKHAVAEESEDDVSALHAVSTVMDAPEGMDTSDKEEDRTRDEKYKALDINLDEPLRDDEKLPVPTHHIVLDSGKAEGETEAVETEKPKKKHKKDREKKEKEKKGKKEKKKRKKSENGDNGPSLLITEHTNGPEEVAPGDSSEVVSREDKAKAELANTEPQDKNADDLDFWLSTNDAPTNSTNSTAATGGSDPQALQNGPAEGVSSPARSKPKVAVENVILTSEEEDPAPTDEKAKKKKEKKSKKDKEKEKQQKKKEKKKLKEKRSEYEVAEGITTPSKESLSLSQQPTPNDVKIPPMSSYLPLAENSAIKLTCESRVNHQRSDQIIVSVVFSNLTKDTIKDLEFNVLDTLNTKLIRGIGEKSQDAVKVPFVLLPEAQNEGQFAFTVDNITMPQKLRGTLTYILKSPDSSTQDKVDFKISLPCSTYLVSTPCTSEEFAALLSNGELEEKASTKFSAVDAQLSPMLARVCFYLHFRVVEQVESSASLYSRSIQGHPVCLLVKLVDGTLSVEGKSSNQTFLSNVVEDVKTLLTSASS
ncbi:AP-3 complex subunit delta-1 isoform X2 [Aplysia californica]|uniref:AP-3 complex subunit delta-1 isoform X2 n=1 Tax=Aplysia californica TaxID=6500 RepID=A0ABM0K368_APLCA|nr:AP-3 complex subunit delta-1 isoform X2 [Aplysia californica]